MIDTYFQRFPGIQRYIMETLETVREQGYSETLFGRKTWFPRIKSKNQAERQGSERAAINAPIQGTSADIIKRAMARMMPALRTGVRTSRSRCGRSLPDYRARNGRSRFASLAAGRIACCRYRHRSKLGCGALIRWALRIAGALAFLGAIICAGAWNARRALPFDSTGRYFDPVTAIVTREQSVIAYGIAALAFAGLGLFALFLAARR